jgi:hypothetical protein
MGDVRGPDQYFGGYATDVDAGATDGAPFDQGHPRTAFNRFKRRGHCRSAAANDGDVWLSWFRQRSSLNLQRILLYFGAIARLDYGRQQCFCRYGRLQENFCPIRGQRYLDAVDTMDTEQRLFYTLGAMRTGHPGDA